ncbi:MAG TPA: hypothetical protein VFQ80_10975, partial [Thermomicrobiales bacterium]|nr:hypothetical protein [Thermomicrobiales bacterium]
MNDQPGAKTAGIVVVLLRDVMARIRLSDVLRQLGYEARFVGDSAAFAATLTNDGGAIALGVIDMNGPVDWDAIAALADEPERPPLLGFGPHVDIAGRRAAKAASVDRIVANGEFHRDAATLIRRYARPM